MYRERILRTLVMERRLLVVFVVFYGYSNDNYNTILPRDDKYIVAIWINYSLYLKHTICRCLYYVIKKDDIFSILNRGVKDTINVFCRIILEDIIWWEIHLVVGQSGTKAHWADPSTLFQQNHLGVLVKVWCFRTVQDNIMSKDSYSPLDVIRNEDVADASLLSLHGENNRYY